MLQEAISETKNHRFHYGWIVALACLPVTMANGAVFFSFSIFFKPMAADFGWSRSQVSLVFTIMLLAYAPGAIVCGRLADRYGPRMVLGVAAVLIGFGLAFSSQVNGLGWLMLNYSMVGLGVSATLGLPTATVQRWFVWRRGLMLGVVAAGVGLGAIVFSPLTHYLITRFGWRTAFLILGILLGIMVAAGASAMVHSPEKRRLQPYGSEPSGPNLSGLGHGSHLNMTTAQAIRTRTFAHLLAVNVISTLPGFFLLGHLVAYATDKGISPGAAASALGLMGAFSVVGRLALGPLGERVGWMRTLALSCFACALATLWLIVVTELWMLYVFAMIYGFFWGGRLPPLIASVAWLFGTASLAELIGITLAAGVVVGASAPLLAGFVYDRTGSYLPALIGSIGIFAAGGILSLLLRPPKSRSP